MDEAVRHDRDETRRLLYMALVAAQAGKQISLDLAGTIVNAVVHHSQICSETDAVTLMTALVADLEVAAEGLPEKIHKLIDTLTGELLADA